MLHGLCFGEEAGARNLGFFRVKWLQATMKGTSCVRRLRLRSVCRFFLPQCNSGLKLLWVCLCVCVVIGCFGICGCRSHWNGCVKAAWCLEWLHPGCDSDLSLDFRNFGASNFPFKTLFEKCFKIVFFSLWRRDPVLELQFRAMA